MRAAIRVWNILFGNSYGQGVAAALNAPETLQRRVVVPYLAPADEDESKRQKIKLLRDQIESDEKYAAELVDAMAALVELQRGVDAEAAVNDAGLATMRAELAELDPPAAVPEVALPDPEPAPEVRAAETEPEVKVPETAP